MNSLNTSWEAERLSIHIFKEKTTLFYGVWPGQSWRTTTRSIRRSVHKCPLESALPRSRQTGHPQTVHALASYLAALPRNSSNEPSTVNKPHLTCCKIEPNTSDKAQRLLQKTHLQSNVRHKHKCKWQVNRAELAGARMRYAAMQSHQIYVHAHLEWPKMSISSRDAGMATASDVPSEHQRRKAQRGLTRWVKGESWCMSCRSLHICIVTWGTGAGMKVSSVFTGKAEFISFLLQN